MLLFILKRNGTNSALLVRVSEVKIYLNLSYLTSSLWICLHFIKKYTKCNKCFRERVGTVRIR